MSRPSYFKTCLVSHTFNGTETSFPFNLREQINTDIKYDEVHVSYITFSTASSTNISVKIYVPEFQQWLGSMYDANRIWMNSSYSINLEGRQVPQSITLEFVNNYTSAPFAPQNNDDIQIMLTFIKY